MPKKQPPPPTPRFHSLSNNSFLDGQSLAFAQFFFYRRGAPLRDFAEVTYSTLPHTLHPDLRRLSPLNCHWLVRPAERLRCRFPPPSAFTDFFLWRHSWRHRICFFLFPLRFVLFLCSTLCRFCPPYSTLSRWLLSTLRVPGFCLTLLGAGGGGVSFSGFFPNTPLSPLGLRRDPTPELSPSFFDVKKADCLYGDRCKGLLPLFTPGLDCRRPPFRVHRRRSPSQLKLASASIKFVNPLQRSFRTS